MLYIFGGYIITGGKFDDGRTWEGCRLLLAKVRHSDDVPVTALSVKGDKKLINQVRNLMIGQPVLAYFDENGKCVLIQDEFDED